MCVYLEWRERGKEPWQCELYDLWETAFLRSAELRLTGIGREKRYDPFWKLVWEREWERYIGTVCGCIEVDGKEGSTLINIGSS